MTPFNCVVLSTDLEDKKWELFPIVASAWKKLFGVSVHLAVVVSAEAKEEPGTGRATLRATLTPEQSQALESDFGFVSILPSDGRPPALQARIARCVMAAALEPRTRVLLSSVDLLPLSAALIEGRLSGPSSGVVALGSEFFSGAAEGAFLGSPVLADAATLARAFRPDTGLTWRDCHSAVDGDVSTTDEQILRDALRRAKAKIDRRLFFPAAETIRCNPGQSSWDVDPERLSSSKYALARLPSPLADNLARINPLLEAIGLPPRGRFPISP